MKVHLICIAGWLFVLFGCRQFSAPPNQQITVFAAASLTDAFSELTTEFEAQTEIETNVNFAGSSQLAVQLHEGAAADVFASANPNQMQSVVESGVVSAETVQTFTTNQLAAIVPAVPTLIGCIAGPFALVLLVGPRHDLVLHTIAQPHPRPLLEPKWLRSGLPCDYVTM